MLLRPTDEGGDILPVLRYESLLDLLLPQYALVNVTVKRLEGCDEELIDALPGDMIIGACRKKLPIHTDWQLRMPLKFWDYLPWPGSSTLLIRPHLSQA